MKGGLTVVEGRRIVPPIMTLLTRRPVGFLKLCSFLPDGTHLVPGKQTLHFDVCNGTG